MSPSGLEHPLRHHLPASTHEHGLRPGGDGVSRDTLFEGQTLRVALVAARPVSDRPGQLERARSNILALPIEGVFAKHDGPNSYALACPNSALLIPSGSEYRISYPAAIGDRCLSIYFPDTTLADVLMAERGHEGWLPGTALLSPLALLARAAFVRAAGAGDPLQLEETALFILGHVLGTLDQASRTHARGVAHTRGRAALELVQAAVAVRPQHKWTISELAKIADLSPFYLSRLFRAQLGLSVYSYVLRMRLAAALEAILEGDEGIAAIAARTGFTSHSHLTAHFRRFFEVTPLEVRRSRQLPELAGRRRAEHQRQSWRQPG